MSGGDTMLFELTALFAIRLPVMDLVAILFELTALFAI